jgi:ABC-type glycerol-3-phosphate transport system permease component
MRLAEVVKYCSILVASVPAMVAYPFVQKFFVKGVMIGSIKG